MRAAPAFTLDQYRPASWRAAVLFLNLAAVAAILPWLAVAASHSPITAAIATTAGLLAIAGALTLATRRPQRLRWTGQEWQFGVQARPGRVEIGLDFGGFVLLRLVDGDRAAAWLPLAESGADPRTWHALRCALHAPHG